MAKQNLLGRQGDAPLHATPEGAFLVEAMRQGLWNEPAVLTLRWCLEGT